MIKRNKINEAEFEHFKVNENRELTCTIQELHLAIQQYIRSHQKIVGLNYVCHPRIYCRRLTYLHLHKL